ncbi:MAG TPA: sigma-70 family RNA polymerase sigma factor [Polyangiaceae bacterium]|nr:sigma-70 family RNA polymerase sigma factor [Polyangiaceae bacterium]
MSVVSAHLRVVRSAAEGDDEALAVLIRMHHDRVYRFGRRVCRDGADADDAVQEAFIKLAKRPDVIVDRGALSWLLSVVRRACLRLLRPFARRRRALGEPHEADDAPSTTLDPERAFERFELARRVHAAIAKLPQPCREVLILRDLEGLSGEETSSALGIDLAAMKSRLHRARTMMRESLREAPRANDRFTA